jgi:phage shock protein E
MDLRTLVHTEGATVVDVREPWELNMGRVAGSVNIPLGEVPNFMKDFETMSKPIIMVCASGNRSGQAAGFLQMQGIGEVYNGGSWKTVDLIAGEKVNQI